MQGSGRTREAEPRPREIRGRQPVLCAMRNHGWSSAFACCARYISEELLNTFYKPSAVLVGGEVDIHQQLPHTR